MMHNSESSHASLTMESGSDKARRFIQDRIFEFLMQRQQTREMPPNTVADIVRRLEEGLFKTATSKEDYMNLDTLETRLYILIKGPGQRSQQQQQQQRDDSSNTMGTSQIMYESINKHENTNEREYDDLINQQAKHDLQNKEARQLRDVQLRKILDLLVHAAQCRASLCQYPNCRKLKGLFRHGMHCKVRATGGCDLCKKMWHLLQLHAIACKDTSCNVPHCRDLREHLRRLNQQADSRGRAEEGGGYGDDEAESGGDCWRKWVMMMMVGLSWLVVCLIVDQSSKYIFGL